MRLETEPDVATPRVEQNFDPALGSLPENTLSNEDLSAGIAAARSGDRIRAHTLLTAAAEKDPADIDAWLWLASISESPEKLLGYLDNVLAVEPENQRALQWRNATCSMQSKAFVKQGVTAFQAGDLELAEQCFDQAIANSPQSASGWFNKAKVVSEYEDRLECLNRVLKLEPGHREAREMIDDLSAVRAEELFFDAATAAVAGEFGAANELLKRALEIDGSHLGSLTLRSFIEPSLENKVVEFEKILAADPNNELARQGKEFLSGIFRSAADRKVVEEAAEDEVATDSSTENGGFEAADASKEVSLDVPSEQDFTAPDPAVSTHAEQLEVETAFEQKSENGPIYVRLEDAAAVHPIEDNIHEFPTLDSFSIPPMSDQPENVNESDSNARNEPLTFGAADETAAVDDLADADEPGLTVARNLQPADQLDTEEEFDRAETAEGINAALAAYDAIQSDVAFADGEDLEPAPDHSFSDLHSEPTAFEDPCPFCNCDNDPKAFLCRECHAVLSISDIDSLLCDGKCDQEVIQRAVTGMEAEWNLREFDEDELTDLALGYFNLNNFDKGLSYLKEASRLSPNNVILSGQINALSIRIEDFHRLEDVHDGLAKGKTILVVDDSATVRKLISSKLEKCGHKVVTAVDGDEAVGLFEEVVPDLVLLDITMPRMDGYAACKIMRANQTLKNVPVVMISGKDGFFDKVRGRMAGASGYITKPFGPETLMRALETYLVADTDLAAVENV